MKKTHTADARVQALDERALRLGAYIAEHRATVRSAARAFGISKSTVHKDISVRLPALHQGLYTEVRGIIEQNKQERHIRGGLATKRKYERSRAAVPGKRLRNGKMRVFPLDKVREKE